MAFTHILQAHLSDFFNIFRIVEVSMKEIVGIMMAAFCLLFVISAVSANETGFTLGIYGNANMD